MNVTFRGGCVEDESGAKWWSAELLAKVEKERDEARRMWCEAAPVGNSLSVNDMDRRARTEATRRGWDCFKDNPTGNALTLAPQTGTIHTMIQFDLPNVNNETECFLSREANLTINGQEHRIFYMIIFMMKGNADRYPTITEIVIESIPDLDDYTYAANLSDEECERRQVKRDEVYEAAKEIFNKYYNVESTQAKM